MIIFLSIFAFILGSIPSGIIVAKVKGIDLRAVGSGNIGATNVLRAVGKIPALITLISDMLKGVIPVLLGIYFHIEEPYLGMLAVITVLGHDYSIFMKGKGGKGVATSLGVFFVYSPLIGLVNVISWVLTAFTMKYSSLSALVAFGLLPINLYILDYSPHKLITSIIISGLIFLKHRQNISRLVNGTEPKIGKSPKGD